LKISEALILEFLPPFLFPVCLFLNVSPFVFGFYRKCWFANLLLQAHLQNNLLPWRDLHQKVECWFLAVSHSSLLSNHLNKKRGGAHSYDRQQVDLRYFPEHKFLPQREFLPVAFRHPSLFERDELHQ